MASFSPELDQKIALEVEKGKTCNIPQLLRVSFSISNTLNECDRPYEAIKEILVRRMKEFKNNYRADENSGKWEYVVKR